MCTTCVIVNKYFSYNSDLQTAAHIFESLELIWCPLSKSVKSISREVLCCNNFRTSAENCVMFIKL